MNRNGVPSDDVAQTLLTSIGVRLSELERRACWPGMTRAAFSDTMEPGFLGPELMTTPGYPTYTMQTATLTLDPGRWVVAYRSTMTIAASDGGEVGMISTAVVDGVTITKTSRGGRKTKFPIGFGDGYTLSNAMELLAETSIVLSLPVFWGYQPLVDPLPYLFSSFVGASIVAFPG